MANSFYDNAMFGEYVTEKPVISTRYYVDFKTWEKELMSNPNTIGIQSGNTDLEMCVISRTMYTRYGNHRKWSPKVYQAYKTFFDMRRGDADDYTYWIKACGLPLTTELILDNWET